MGTTTLPRIEVVDGLISEVHSSIATIVRPRIAPSLISALEQAGLVQPNKPLPKLSDGEFKLLSSKGDRPFDAVLLVGSDEERLSYESLHRYGRRLIEGVSKHMPSAERISLITHGAGYGLDVMLAFEHLVNGIEEGLAEFGPRLARLEGVLIVEVNKHRADHFREMLDARRVQAFTEGASRGVGPAAAADLDRSSGRAIVEPKRDWTRGPIHCDVFVAMPFADDYADIFDLGIYEPARECGLVCERTDRVKFVGDIARFMFDRIERAKLVVAEVTEPNANVYLEVGYAWGKGVPVLFIARDPEKMKFDVRGHRCLKYGRITELKKSLREEFGSIAEVIRGGRE
jgi:hypothetical protein